MKGAIKHYLLLSLGWCCVFLGVIGLFLPILQGILFLAIGFIILSRRSARVRLLNKRLCKKYPKYAIVQRDATNRIKMLKRKYFKIK
ncbi:MAG: hypothetical protein CMM83_02830 [Rhodospirillales bacterium]|nr:hypothetical protein [Rhodospirillales bacterium]|tara:strand:- start:385 stop:645 length:261 start_codon:yes stop_codon:yes gene_type:complete